MPVRMGNTHFIRRLACNITDRLCRSASTVMGVSLKKLTLFCDEK